MTFLDSFTIATLEALIRIFAAPIDTLPRREEADGICVLSSVSKKK